MPTPDETAGPGVDGSLLSAYVTTMVTGPDGRTWSGADAIDELPDGEYWVITGWNPFSERVSEARNLDAQSRLLETIRGHGVAVTAVDGCAPDHSWCEPAFAFPRSVPLEVVCSWARAFDQHAVFALTPHEHLVVDAGSERTIGSRPRVTT